MRLGLLLATMLVAGCAQPAEPAPPAPGPLPPTLLVDRAAPGKLQLYVHAKSGNVRYDFINVSVDNATLRSEAARYSLEHVLEAGAAFVGFEVVEGEARYAWAAQLALNETAAPPTLLVSVLEEHGRFAVARELGLPYEKLLPRAEEA